MKMCLSEVGVLTERGEDFIFSGQEFRDAVDGRGASEVGVLLR